MDPLSDVLSLIKIRSVLSARFEGRGPWAMRFPAYRHIKFGAVLEGSFSLWVDGSAAPLQCASGDFYLLTDGSPYCSASDLTALPLDGRIIFERHKEADGVVRYGSQGDKVVVAGGRFTFDDATSDLLLKQLPPVVHLAAAAPGAAPLRALLDLLADETETVRPGFAIAAASIANIVLVHILRAHLAATPASTGWFSAIRDRRIATALTLMHSELARRWTVNDLALAVGMSRTAFTQRFKLLVGLPPLGYLLRWRMTVAGTKLKTGVESLSKVAASVGYGSDTAFNSAFKRSTGQSPGRYRSQADERDWHRR